jgi:formate dehydrogenase maturation protein FdhE
MIDVWEQRIRRAEQLAEEPGPAASLLAFYVRVLREQKRAYDGFASLTARPLEGTIAADLPLIATCGKGLLNVMLEYGPETLRSEARVLDAHDATRERAVVDYSLDRSDRRFFPKALLQAYGQWVADMMNTPIAANSAPRENQCPRCGGAPQLAILGASGASSLDGSSRQLLCATCLTTWSLRRIMCPSCGEENERQLQYFQSTTVRHVRIDACDACGRYLKTIDLGQLGFAVPLVDEVAAAALDIWACERGYQKIELNLLGL